MAGRARRLAAKPDAAGVRLQHIGDEPQQGRLAAAARPDNRGKLAGRHMHVDLVEREHRFATAVKDHGDLVDLDVARHEADLGRPHYADSAVSM